MSTDTYIDLHVGADPKSASPDYFRIGYLYNFQCDSQTLDGAKEVDDLGRLHPINIFDLFRSKWSGILITTETIREICSEYRRIYTNAQKDKHNDFKNDILTATEVEEALQDARGQYIQFRVD